MLPFVGYEKWKSLDFFSVYRRPLVSRTLVARLLVPVSVGKNPIAAD